jgi:hypothetical protein
MLETVRFAVPVFEMVSSCESVLPTITLPKFADEGLTEIYGVPWFVTSPTPLRLTVTGEEEALLAIEIVPVAFPADAGLKVAVNVALCPAETTVELVRFARLKPVPTVLICENVRSAVPLFATTIDCVAVAPTFTVPKLTEVGVTDISGAGVPLDPPTICFPVTPMQPEATRIAHRTIRLAKNRNRKAEDVRAV